ncbi:Uncharacterized protein HZ326_21688 [Fusarium oxysporum f. sp. albedinis]|nr:Uncharacterized protein HZ326_21688 [Fusarium oxysporum f. sp. albedinis]
MCYLSSYQVCVLYWLLCFVNAGSAQVSYFNKRINIHFYLGALVRIRRQVYPLPGHQRIRTISTTRQPHPPNSARRKGQRAPPKVYDPEIVTENERVE